MITLQSIYYVKYRSTHTINRVLIAGYRCKVQLDTSPMTVTSNPLFVVYLYSVTLQYFRGHFNHGSLLDTLVAYSILDVIRIVTIGCNKGQR